MLYVLLFYIYIYIYIYYFYFIFYVLYCGHWRRNRGTLQLTTLTIHEYKHTQAMRCWINMDPMVYNKTNIYIYIYIYNRVPGPGDLVGIRFLHGCPTCLQGQMASFLIYLV